jgi:hypothetical protein
VDPLLLIRRVTHLPRPLCIAIGSALAVLLILLLFPYNTTVVPPWTLRVIDHLEQPVAGINVTQHWQNYLLEPKGHEELRSTPGNGEVDFPERTIRASLFTRGLARITKATRSGVEKRTDCYASVVVWGSKEYETTAAVHNGSEISRQTIVVHRLNYNTSPRVKENKNRWSELGMSSR